MPQPTTKETIRLVERLDYPKIIMLEIIETSRAEADTENPEKFIARVNAFRRLLLPLADKDYTDNAEIIEAEADYEEYLLPKRNAYGHANTATNQATEAIHYKKSKKLADELMLLSARKGLIQLTLRGTEGERELLDIDFDEAELEI